MSKILQLLLWLLSVYLINSLQIEEETVLLYNETYMKEDSGDQLSDETIPLSYELKMVPDLETFSFNGEVRITILIKSSTNFVMLNEKGLNITSCQVLLGEVVIQSMCNSNHTEQLLVIKTFQNLIPDTTYFLDIKFQGELNTEATGFYGTSYVINNDTYWLATTQFEETYAREAFPCFDEIRFKTPYTIYLAHFPDQKAISNMPIEEKLLMKITHVSDRIWTKFQTSPPMPSYLVAFMVSDFSSMSSVGEDTQITVWTRRNVIEYASYALKQSINYMKYFEEYTNIPFTLPKLDVIAVPNFNDAMENWGMTTYSENYVILDEQMSSERHKLDLKTLLCHEIVHQWFGNLVTPASWRTYWLKEGFATYFQYFAIATEQPKWNMDHFFVIDVLQQALKEESQNPKAMTIMLAEKIPVPMDYAGYQKAASIIRMFEHVVSPGSFKVMLQNFLRNGAGRHKGTVTTANLFEEFDKLPNNEISYLPEEISFSKILKIWSENVGFPLVLVTQNYSTQTIKVQHATYEGIEQDTNITPNQKWIIPLTYTTKSQLKFFNTRPMLWSYTNITIELPGITYPDDWILFNLQQTGYYRVNYDLRNWQLLINQLYDDPMKIHVLNRAQLIDDSIELAADGKLTYNITFSLLQYLTKEIEMAPWHSAISSLQVLYQKYEGTSLREYLKEFLQQIMEPAYKNFGFKINATDSHIEKIVKPELLYFACDIGIEGCIREALKEYMKNENDPRRVNPDLKPVVFCTALRYHDDPYKVFNTLWSMYLTTPILSEKLTIISTMKCIENVEIIKKLLSEFKDIKNHDTSIQNELEQVFLSQSFTEVTIQKLNEEISTISESNDYGSMYLLLRLEIKSEKQLRLLKEFISQLQSLHQKNVSLLTEKAQDIYSRENEKLIIIEKKSNVLKSVLHTILKKSEKFDSSDGVSISLFFFKWLYLMLTVALLIFTTNNNL